MKKLRWIIGILLLTCTSTPCLAQTLKATSGDWPWWRGPNHNGVAEAGQQLPTSWSDTKNVAWKVAIPGRGHSSPTVVGNRVFLTTADEQTQTQSVLCLDRKSGKTIWKRDINKGGFPERIHRKNTHASPTIACDGQRLFATFYHHGNVQLAVLDLDGKPLWQRAVGKLEPQQYKNGYAASPTLYGKLVIVASDCDSESFVAAFDRVTGKPVWNTTRPARINYASPIVGKVAGRDQLLMSGCDMVASYDPQNGNLLWKSEATTMATAGTMVWEGNLVFASGGFPKVETVCIRADGSGEVVWRINQKMYEQSMLVHQGHIYGVNDAGIAICFKADTGEELWRQRLGGPISASPILVGDRIYICNERGKSWVIRATPKKFDLLGESELGFEVFSTPTICGGQLFLRVANRVDGQRQETLYCIQADTAK